MYSMSRYWVAAVIIVRVRILLSFRLDEHCMNAAFIFTLVVNQHRLETAVYVGIPESQEILMIRKCGRQNRYKLFTFIICRTVTSTSHNRLASAMDRSIRVSMKNAASCVIYHELQTLRVVKF